MTSCTITSLMYRLLLRLPTIIMLRLSIKPNSASNHHNWRPSSITLDDTFQKLAFNGSASSANFAISVPQIKVEINGKDELLRIAIPEFTSTFADDFV